MSDHRTCGDQHRAPCPFCGAWVRDLAPRTNLIEGAAIRCGRCRREVVVAAVITTIRVELDRPAGSDDDADDEAEGDDE